MALIKNPFSREAGNEQMTPDLLSPNKIEETQAKIKKEVEKKGDKAREEVEKEANKMLQKVESDKFNLAGKQVPKQPSQASGSQKSINLQKIESVMQGNLEEIYFNMDEAHRRMFKSEGERIARQVEQVVNIGKSVAVKVLELVKSWLKLIPGVNKFFIEQEAKIKTDKILKITGS